MPPDEEIKRVRRLISRVKADLDDLSEDERGQVFDAVVRRSRNTVIVLGLPPIHQPLPDLRPDRSA